MQRLKVSLHLWNLGEDVTQVWDTGSYLEFSGRALREG
jgi:hypothetical protein